MPQKRFLNKIPDSVHPKLVRVKRHAARAGGFNEANQVNRVLDQFVPTMWDRLSARHCGGAIVEQENTEVVPAVHCLNEWRNACVEECRVPDNRQDTLVTL